jgi:hypothetical protein
MKSTWKWILFGLVVFLIGFCVAFPLLGGFAGLPLRAAHVGGTFMNRGTMMGWGGIGIVGLVGRGVIPLLGVILLAAAVILLLRKPSNPPAPAAAPTPCPSCGKPIQPGWVACPHCGNKL